LHIYTHVYTLAHFLFLSFISITLRNTIHGLWYFQSLMGDLYVSAYYCKAIILWKWVRKSTVLAGYSLLYSHITCTFESNST